MHQRGPEERGEHGCQDPVLLPQYLSNLSSCLRLGVQLWGVQLRGITPLLRCIVSHRGGKWVAGLFSELPNGKIIPFSGSNTTKQSQPTVKCCAWWILVSWSRDALFRALPLLFPWTRLYLISQRDTVQQNESEDKKVKEKEGQEPVVLSRTACTAKEGRRVGRASGQLPVEQAEAVTLTHG